MQFASFEIQTIVLEGCFSRGRDIRLLSHLNWLPFLRVSQVNAALKRGVEYGILRRYRGHYFLPTGDELDRANRIAERFAGLSASASLLIGSKTTVGLGRRIRDHKGARRIGNKRRRDKKVRKISSTPVSASSSCTDKMANDGESGMEWGPY